MSDTQPAEITKLLSLRERMSDHEIHEDILAIAGRLQWYALGVSPQKEFVAQKMLRRYGLRTFVPIRTEFRHRSKQARVTRQPKQRVIYPLARSYVFAGFEPGVPLWFELFDLPNIRGAVHVHGRPLQIPGREMQALIRSTASGINAPEVERFMRTHHEFKAGDEVRIVAGPFEGLVVPVVAIEEGFASLAVELFGGAIQTVKAPVFDLEAA